MRQIHNPGVSGFVFPVFVVVVIIALVGAGSLVGLFLFDNSAEEASLDMSSGFARKSFVQTADEIAALLGRIDEMLGEGMDVSAELGSLMDKKDAIEDLDPLIREGFEETEQRCIDEGFSQIILDRHDQVVSDYDRCFGVLSSDLESIGMLCSSYQRGVGDIEWLSERVSEAIAHLVDLNEQRPVPFAGTGLSRITSFREADEYEVGDIPPVNSIPTQSYYFPADLEPTIDVQITQDVIDLAASLDNSPLEIYEYVRNNFAFEPYYGSVNGSRETLVQECGNDYDLASLLIALLRAAGVPSRYVQGTVQVPIDRMMSWVGVEDGRTAGDILATAGIPGMLIVRDGEIVASRFEHVWVEVYVPNDESGNMWIPLDPSFKDVEYQQCLDIPDEMGFDVEAFVDEYISTFHDDSPVEIFITRIRDHIAANYLGLSYDDVLRWGSIMPESLGMLPGSLPYETISRNAEYSEIPDSERHKIRFHLHDSGGTLLDYNATLAEIAGKQITISYVAASSDDRVVIDAYGGLYETPPHLVDLKPVLKIDGVAVAEGSRGIMMGTVHSSDIHFITPSGVSNDLPVVYNNIICGTYQGIGIDTMNVPWQIFMPSDDGVVPDTDGLTGLKLWRTAMNYLERVDRAEMQVARTMHMVTVEGSSEAIVENAIGVTYVGGTPWTFEWVGLRVDAGRKLVSPFSVGGDEGESKSFMMLTGADGSVSENRLFEDEYGESAVSAIKIIELASDRGIPIYEIDENNIDTVFPLLGLPDYVKAAISDAVGRGRVVTVPQLEIEYGSLPWCGVGYVDMDPATGEADYIIPGGAGGGETIDWWMNGEVAWFVVFKGVDHVAADITYPATDTYFPYRRWAEFDWSNPRVHFDVAYTIHYDDDTSEVIYETYRAHWPYSPGHYVFYAGWATGVTCDFVVYGVNVKTLDQMYVAKGGDSIVLEAEVVPEMPPAAAYQWFTRGIGGGTFSSPNSLITEFSGTEAGELEVGVTVVYNGQTGDAEDVVVFGVEIGTPDGVYTVKEGYPVTLEANVTPSALPGATYDWTVVSGPGNGEFSDSSDSSPEFTGRDFGELMVEVVVTNDGMSISATLHLIVSGVMIEVPDGIYVAKGGEPIALEAKAVVSLPPQAVYSWTVESGPGDGWFDNSSAVSPEFTGTVPGELVVNVEVLIDGHKIWAVRELTVLEVRAVSVGFMGDHDISEWPGAGVIGKDVGNDVPVWTSAGMNDPVCYTVATPPAMFAEFEVSPGIMTPITGVDLRVRSGDVVIGYASGLTIGDAVINDVASNDGDVDGIGWGAAIPGSDAVRTSAEAFVWEISPDGGNSWLFAGNSGSHTIHWIQADPQENPLYDLALDKACGYVNGSADVAGKIREGIHRDIPYESGDWHIESNPLTMYAGGRHICADFANLMAYLSRSAGLDAHTELWWGGVQWSGYDAWVCVSFGYPITLEHVMPGDYIFPYHAVANVEGMVQDAALNVTSVTADAIYAGNTIYWLDIATGSLSDGIEGSPYYQEISRVGSIVGIQTTNAGALISSDEASDEDWRRTSIEGSVPGGIVSVHWSVSEGGLPPGLSLDTYTGVISGTPTAVGTWEFTIATTDVQEPSYGDVQPLSITIYPG